MMQGELYIHVRWEEDEEEVPQSSKLFPKKRYKLKDYIRRHVQCIWEDIETELLPFV